MAKGRKFGTKITYTPQETGRYRSQWLRLKRAETKDVDRVGENEWQVGSQRSPFGYWTVTRDPEEPGGGGGSPSPGPGVCPGSLYLPSEGASALAAYAYWIHPDDGIPRPGLPVSLGFGWGCGSSHMVSNPPDYPLFSSDFTSEGLTYLYYQIPGYSEESLLFVALFFVVYQASDLPISFPAGEQESPWALIENYQEASTYFCEPDNADPDRGYCYPPSGGGGVGGNPSPRYLRCNCPDYTRKEPATGRWQSEQVARDWSSSNAGSGNVAGVQQDCKHILAVKLELNEPIYAQPQDWVEMESWANYVGNQAALRRRRRVRRQIREAARQRKAFGKYRRWLERVGRQGSYSRKELNRRQSERTRFHRQQKADWKAKRAAATAERRRQAQLPKRQQRQDHLQHRFEQAKRAEAYRQMNPAQQFFHDLSIHWRKKIESEKPPDVTGMGAWR